MYSRNYKAAVFFALISSICISSAIAADPEFPYEAEVIGKNISVFSAPGTQGYVCNTVSSPEKVTVVSIQDTSWSKIMPPEGSFSWISADYIQLNKSMPGVGMVTGNSVNVWAGSDKLSPLHSNGLQTALNKGEIIAISGPVKEGYYKILPPIGAYLWIKSKHIKFAGAIKTGETLKPSDFNPISPPKPTVTETAKVEIETPKPKVDVPTAVTGGEPVTPVKPVPVPQPQPVSAETVRLQECYEIKDLLEAERQKPIDQQGYAQIESKLQDILADDQAGKALRYAEFEMDMVKRFKLAVEVENQLKQQEADLAATLESIKRKYENASAKIPVTAQYTVSGIIKKSQVYTASHSQQRFLIIDETGKIICYALPDNASVRYSAMELLNKKVGLKGRISKDPNNSVSIVRFTQAVAID